MTILTILLLTWLHFVADFVLQSHNMAINKSKDNYWLSVHVAVYSSVLFIAGGFVFALVNGVLHWMTDYFTSRKTSKLWADNRVHDFFVVIGFDQAIHLTCLVLTAHFMHVVPFGWVLPIVHSFT